MKLLAYDIEGNDKPLGRVAAVARAKQFDFIVAQREMYGPSGTYTGDGNAMIAANPTLKLCMYLNGVHMNQDAVDRYKFPADWYVRSSSGAPVKGSGEWAGLYLMNPLTPYLDWLVNFTRTKFAGSQFNALYVDELGVGPISSVSSTPIDPRTNQPFTWKTWMDVVVMLEQRFKSEFSVPIYVNGLGNGVRFFDTSYATRGETVPGPTSALLPWCSGALAESFIRGAKTTKPDGSDYWPTNTALDREIHMLEIGAAPVWACSKIWLTKTDAFLEQVHKYCLAAFMLGADPSATWYFTKKRATTVTPLHPLWTTAKSLGAPLGPRSGYTRAYEHGHVSLDNVKHTGSIVKT